MHCEHLREAVDNRATFDGLYAVAQRETLRGGQAVRIADLEAVRLERGVHHDAVASSVRLAADDVHDGGVAARLARAKVGAE